MKTIIAIAALLLSSLTLAGCAFIDVQSYGTVDLSDKSVTVPPGGDSIDGSLKKYLSSNGWRMFVYNSDVTKITGDSGKNTSLEERLEFKSRYRIITSWKNTHHCLNGDYFVLFDLSFIDNKSGSEVFTMSAEECEGKIVKAFGTTLTGNKTD